jgi:hypothetical protein
MPKAPQFCPMIYRDSTDIYLEFSNIVLKFPFSEGGLSKALKHIPDVTERPGYVQGASKLLNLPVTVAKKTKRRAAVRITDPEAEALNKVLEGLKEDKRK